MRPRLAGTVGTGVAFIASLGVIAGVAFNQPVNSVGAGFTSATTTICAIQNTSGYTRQITDIKTLYTATPSVGSVAVQVGRSATRWGTLSPVFVNTRITTASSADVNVPTSTLRDTTATMPIWPTGTWLRWVSNTSTSAGVCAVSFL